MVTAARSKYAKTNISVQGCLDWFGGCGSCIGCFGCGGCIVAVATELVVVVVSGVALYFIYFIGVSSSVLSEIDTSTSFYKNDLYRAKCWC